MTKEQARSLRDRILSAHWHWDGRKFAEAIGHDLEKLGYDDYFEEKWTAFQKLAFSVRSLGPLFEELFSDKPEQKDVPPS